jgi:redox-sensitive bicupin YhaK (pirin superfamily)
MNRKDFIKKGLMGSGALATASSALGKILNEKKSLSPETDIIGFNHLPAENEKVMKNMILHKADSRGLADHGWLKSRHTFSFAHYYNPERMQFGALRVLNDDVIQGGRGFGTHPHDNMEIISIALGGDLEHKDSMGNAAVIRQGDIQVMSAGRGIYHSEYNHNPDKVARFLQIWVFPNKRNVEPRYDQIHLNPQDRKDTFQQILSPFPDDAGVWIHQDAWFHLGHFSKGKEASYQLKKAGNGIYVFMISGIASVNGQTLGARDGLGIRDQNQLLFTASSDAEILLMEVPVGPS